MALIWRPIFSALLLVVARAGPARGIYSLKYLGHQCHGETATVVIEQLGYGKLWDIRDSSRVVSHDEDSILEFDRTVIGWTHRIKLRPNGFSPGVRHFTAEVGPWGDNHQRLGFRERFSCRVTEDL
mmetsp:Transcript_59192/g.163805  ORF Transcript_59192/g.163805 Transcript_59192/m.163805 type:complete len:126 (-) Transcript_59192:66-443(-)